MIRTEMTWLDLTHDQPTRFSIITKSNEMQDKQVAEKIRTTTEDGQVKIVRFWADEASAQEWFDFVSPLEPVPTSASIIIE